MKVMHERLLNPISTRELERRWGAVRKAMAELAHNPKHPDWAHPFYWAPFLLVGDFANGGLGGAAAKGGARPSRLVREAKP